MTMWVAVEVRCSGCDAAITVRASLAPDGRVNRSDARADGRDLGWDFDQWQGFGEEYHRCPTRAGQP